MESKACLYLVIDARPGGAHMGHNQGLCHVEPGLAKLHKGSVAWLQGQEWWPRLTLKRRWGCLLAGGPM